MVTIDTRTSSTFGRPGRALLSLVMLAGLASCGGTETGGPAAVESDAATDVGGDTPTDVVADVGLDVGVDAGGEDTPVPDDTAPPTDEGGPADADATVLPDAPDAEDIVACASECASAEERRCAPGASDLVQACEEVSSGCWQWGPATACASGQGCSNGECLTTCASDPGCSGAGDKRCVGTTSYAECAQVVASCFKFGEEKACPEFMTCSGSGECVCENTCTTKGERKCLGSSTQECTETPVGCLVWGAPTECQGGGSCEGAGECTAPCVSDSTCTAVGDRRCASGTSYQLCVEEEPGCLKWDVSVACPGALSCGDAGQCQVLCTSDPGCTSAGVLSCLDSSAERTCQEIEPGCFKWGQPKACPLHQACAGSGGCVCENACTDGATACVDGDPAWSKVCTLDAAGCRYWSPSACGAAAQCENGACKKTCVSNCAAAGDTRCETAEVASTCAPNAADASCLQYTEPKVCPAHQLCSQETGDCECLPSPGCQNDGQKYCADYASLATCAKDANGCLYVASSAPCDAGTVCAEGVCTSTCVSDPDCALGKTRCATAGGLEQCVEVADHPGCIRWGAASACPDRQECAGQACACVNPCDEGENTCVGLGQVRNCGAADAAGCTAWSAPTACNDGTVCVAGTCQSVVSAEVQCGSLTLRVVDQAYQTVLVAGSFNEWQGASMNKADGIWSTTVALPAGGEVQYKFIADGQWMLDPLNPKTVGEGVTTNNVVKVTASESCPADGETRCGSGLLETCTKVEGCLAWTAASQACGGATEYCSAGQCLSIQSPVVTATAVTFMVRDQGFPVEVTGDFLAPAWATFVPLGVVDGYRTATLQRKDVPGLTTGKHLYKFRPNGEALWFYDPANPAKEDDGVGGFNSVFEMPPPDCGSAPACTTAGSDECTGETSTRQCTLQDNGCLIWTPSDCSTSPMTYCLQAKCEAFPRLDADAHTVTFVFKSTLPLTAVWAVGTFHDSPWALSDARKLQLTAADTWTAVTAPLAAGVYSYKFVTDDGSSQSWVPDPHNPQQVDDGYGGSNSVFEIP